MPPQHTSINCSVCGQPVHKTLADRIHRCPFCNVVTDRDYNAAWNILLKSTAGTVGSNACFLHFKIKLNKTTTFFVFYCLCCCCFLIVNTCNTCIGRFLVTYQ